MHSTLSVALTMFVLAVAAVLMGWGFYEDRSEVWGPGIALVAAPILYWGYRLEQYERGLWRKI